MQQASTAKIADFTTLSCIPIGRMLIHKEREYIHLRDVRCNALPLRGEKRRYPFPSCTSMCVLLNLQITATPTRTGSFKSLEQIIGRSGGAPMLLFIYTYPDRRPGQYPRSFPSTNLETLLICDAFGIKLKTHVDIQDNGSAS